MTYPGRRSLVAVLFGVVALGVFAVAPASAQGCPVPPNSLKAMFTSIQIQASSNPQSWVATIGLRVDCISPSGQDIGDVNATVDAGAWQSDPLRDGRRWWRGLPVRARARGEAPANQTERLIASTCPVFGASTATKPEANKSPAARPYPRSQPI